MNKWLECDLSELRIQYRDRLADLGFAHRATMAAEAERDAAIARAERAEAALAQCQVWRQEEADSLNHCIRAKQQAEAYAADRESEAKACHNIMAECRTIAGDSHTGTVDAVRGLLARAERAEASLVECASNGLKLREELADVYRRAERSEAALEAMRSDGMIQRLADQQHEIWSHWMRYLFSCCAPAGDGSMLIPVEKVERWQRQMQTPYGSLSEYEQGSDINQAMKIIAVLTSDNDLLSAGGEAGNE